MKQHVAIVETKSLLIAKLWQVTYRWKQLYNRKKKELKCQPAICYEKRDKLLYLRY